MSATTEPTPGMAASAPTPVVAIVAPTTGVAASAPTTGVAAVAPTPGVAASAPTTGVTAVAPTPLVAIVAPTTGVAAVAPTPLVAIVAPSPVVAAPAPTTGMAALVPNRAIAASAPTSVVAIVVPAHNEEDRIAACVAGIRRAAAHPGLGGVKVHLVVVLDDCQDATGHHAAAALAGSGGSMTAAIVAASLRNVGRARAFGADQAFQAFGAIDPEAVWLATTDADSVVPADWLSHHLELRHGGAEGCAGMVVVDSWQDHPPSTQQAFEALYRPDDHSSAGHPHVHGTNLGMSMAAYLDAGGFPAVATGEDHALWQALIGAGRRLVATRIAPVTTSGRRHGRSPAGFADTLVRLGPAVA